jgi:hypothetical protein
MSSALSVQPEAACMNSQASSEFPVCLVIVYLGAWPVWIEYFFASCQRNPGFHWRIFTDCVPTTELPDNVFIHQITGSQLESRANGIPGVLFKLHHNYKICDLKPLYGHLFAEELKPYRFWGYSDIDVVFGQLGHFISKEELEHYDVITASGSIIAGHFTIFRNTEYFQVLYRQYDRLSEMLLAYDCEAFDEKAFASIVFAEGASGRLRLSQKSMQTDDCIINWSGRPRFLIAWWNGTVVDLFGFRELGYYHFIKTKYSNKFRVLPFTQGSFFVATQSGIRSVSVAADWVWLLWEIARCLIATTPWYIKRLLRCCIPRSLGNRRSGPPTGIS